MTEHWTKLEIFPAELMPHLATLSAHTKQLFSYTIHVGAAYLGRVDFAVHVSDSMDLRPYIFLRHGPISVLRYVPGRRSVGVHKQGALTDAHRICP